MSDTPNPVGRPTKFTPERCAAIVDDIANAIPYHFAALSNGIAESTLFDWLTKGYADIEAGIDSDLARFSELIKKAEKNKLAYHSQKIAANVDRWQADAWMLERRWWKHYSQKTADIEFNDRLNALERKHKDGEAGKEDI